MTLLPLIYAPDPIFKMVAQEVEVVDHSIRKIIDDMYETMYHEGAIGMGANMVGILKRIVVIDLQENGQRAPFAMVNPEIVWCDQDSQTFKEGSICFPGIGVEVPRPKAVKVRYIDYDDNVQEMYAEGKLAVVVQHEMDYLDGITIVDYLSKIKRDMVIKKMQKYLKANPPHVHTEHCNH
jgi:peptide deformylase